MTVLHHNQVPFGESAALNIDSSPATDGTLPAHGITENGWMVLLQHIPDEPTESLAPRSVQRFLHQELSTDLLDTLYPHLWMVGRRASNHIDPLHLHAAKGREIKPIEDPGLHLVWEAKKVYVKPIPVCLFNYHFWRYYLLQHGITSHGVPSATFTTFTSEEMAQSRNQRASALGFLRSYSDLIQRRSDFALAREHNLIPNHIEWWRWQSFITNFRSIDEGVAKRYNYGQLRLSRLNLTVPLVSIARTCSRSKAGRIGWFYYIPYWSIDRMIKSMSTVLIFIFATLSLVLSSIQLAVAISVAEDNKPSSSSSSSPPPPVVPMSWDGNSLMQKATAFWVFSMVVIAASVLIWALLFFPLGVLAYQLSWGFFHRERDESSEKRLAEKEGSL